MSRIEISATDESPAILFDSEKGLLEISGRSLPEDPKKTYFPLEQAVLEYLLNPLKQTTINFTFDYLNSASTKRILRIISHFEEQHRVGIQVTLNWYYDEFDEDMREEGKEFARLTSIEVNLIKRTADL